MSGVTSYGVTHYVNAMHVQRPLFTSRPRSQIDSSLSAKKSNKHADSSSSNKQARPATTVGSAAPLHSIREQVPQRITNQLNVPVRQQIAWAKAKKRLDKQISAPIITGRVKKGGYRRDKRSGDDILSNSTRRSDESIEDFDALDYMNMKPPAIFVDGYNIIGFMKSTTTTSTSSSSSTGSYGSHPIDFEAARDSLISDLCMLRSATGWWIELVFDAYKSGSSQSSSSSTDNIIVTYTSATDTADTFIERRFQELSNEGFTNMVVATDDNVSTYLAVPHPNGCLFVIVIHPNNNCASER